MSKRPTCPRCHSTATTHLGFVQWHCTPCSLSWEHLPPADRQPMAMECERCGIPTHDRSALCAACKPMR